MIGYVTLGTNDLVREQGSTMPAPAVHNGLSARNPRHSEQRFDDRTIEQRNQRRSHANDRLASIWRGMP